VPNGSKLAFRVGVAVGGEWPTVGFGDTQVSERQRYRFGSHLRSAAGVHRQLGLHLVLRVTRIGEALSGGFCSFPLGGHSAGLITATHIQDDVQAEVGPRSRSQNFGSRPRICLATGANTSVSPAPDEPIDRGHPAPDRLNRPPAAFRIGRLTHHIRSIFIFSPVIPTFQTT